MCPFVLCERTVISDRRNEIIDGSAGAILKCLSLLMDYGLAHR